MRKVIQKRIVKVIQSEVVEYYCDYCGKKFGKGEKKETWYDCSVAKAVAKHYHKPCRKEHYEKKGMDIIWQSQVQEAVK